MKYMKKMHQFSVFTENLPHCHMIYIYIYTVIKYIYNIYIYIYIQ